MSRLYETLCNSQEPLPLRFDWSNSLTVPRDCQLLDFRFPVSRSASLRRADGSTIGTALAMCQAPFVNHVSCLVRPRVAVPIGRGDRRGLSAARVLQGQQGQGQGHRGQGHRGQGRRGHQGGRGKGIEGKGIESPGKGIKGKGKGIEGKGKGKGIEGKGIESPGRLLLRMSLGLEPFGPWREWESFAGGVYPLSNFPADRLWLAGYSADGIQNSFAPANRYSR